MSSAAAESSAILYSMMITFFLQTGFLPALSQCHLTSAVPMLTRNMTVRNSTCPITQSACDFERMQLASDTMARDRKR
jgi:hypothetical protein